MNRKERKEKIDVIKKGLEALEETAEAVAGLAPKKKSAKDKKKREIACPDVYIEALHEVHEARRALTEKMLEVTRKALVLEKRNQEIWGELEEEFDLEDEHYHIDTDARKIIVNDDDHFCEEED